MKFITVMFRTRKEANKVLKALPKSPKEAEKYLKELSRKSRESSKGSACEGKYELTYDPSSQYVSFGVWGVAIMAPLIFSNWEHIGFTALNKREKAEFKAKITNVEFKV